MSHPMLEKLHVVRVLQLLVAIALLSIVFYMLTQPEAPPIKIAILNTWSTSAIAFYMFQLSSTIRNKIIDDTCNVLLENHMSTNESELEKWYNYYQQMATNKVDEFGKKSLAVCITSFVMLYVYHIVT